MALNEDIEQETRANKEKGSEDEKLDSTMVVENSTTRWWNLASRWLKIQPEASIFWQPPG